jgi:hypothetical protein
MDRCQRGARRCWVTRRGGDRSRAGRHNKNDPTYSLIEYDLAYKPFKSSECQIVVDFITYFIPYGSYILVDQLAMRVKA